MIRSGLVAAVVAQVGGRLIDEKIAYVTSDAQPRTDLGVIYRVLDEIPFGVKKMRAVLRTRGVGNVVVKKRGIAVVPEQLRQRLALVGTEDATIVLSRTANGPMALLVERFLS